MTREDSPLRLLIVDDEAPARARLRNLLADIAAELPNWVAGEVADGIEALEFLANPSAGRIDVALVDIRMPRLDGIALAQHLAARADSPAVIFTTAYDQYAVRAFDLNAIDYLLKPVRGPRLLAALKKLPRALPDAAALLSLAPAGRQHLHSSERGRILLVPLADILFLKAELKYVTARTRESEYLIEESLTHLEQEFAERFVRVHRNCLVARSALAGVEREVAEDGETRWTVLLHDVAEKLPVSRRQWPLIKALLKDERGFD
jgi:two-component system response regulator AlgR